MFRRRAGRQRAAAVLTGAAVAASTVLALHPETEAQQRTPGTETPDMHTVTLSNPLGGSPTAPAQDPRRPACTRP